jgi:cation transport ATPase
MTIKETLGKWGSLLAPKDPVLVEKTLMRIDEQDKWNDVFSTKLIELLDNIDNLKADVRERLRQAHAVLRAEAMLVDEASKLEEFQKKYENAQVALAEARLEHNYAKQAQDQATQELSQASAESNAAKRGYGLAHQLANQAGDHMRTAEQRYRFASLAAIIALSLCSHMTLWTSWIVLRIAVPVWIPISLTVVMVAVTGYAIKRMR